MHVRVINLFQVYTCYVCSNRKNKKSKRAYSANEANVDKVYALANTAKILWEHGKKQQADTLFTQAFQIAESNELSLMYLSDALTGIGDIDKALKMTDLIIDNEYFKAAALVNIAAAIRNIDRAR